MMASTALPTSTRTDLKCDTVDQVVRHLALLLILRIANRKSGPQIIPLLLEIRLPLGLLFLAIRPAHMARLNAALNLVRVLLELGLQHRLQTGKQVLAPPQALALANVPLGLLALEHEGRDGGGVGRLLGRGGAQLVGHEGAREGLVGVVDAQLGLCCGWVSWVLLEEGGVGGPR
jgi:hypothetical protein